MLWIPESSFSLPHSRWPGILLHESFPVSIDHHYPGCYIPENELASFGNSTGVGDGVGCLSGWVHICGPHALLHKWFPKTNRNPRGPAFFPRSRLGRRLVRRASGGWERAGPGLGPGQEISWGTAASERRSRPIAPRGFSDCVDDGPTSPSHPGASRQEACGLCPPGADGARAPPHPGAGALRRGRDEMPASDAFPEEAVAGSPEKGQKEPLPGILPLRSAAWNLSLILTFSNALLLDCFPLSPTVWPLLALPSSWTLPCRSAVFPETPTKWRAQRMYPGESWSAGLLLPPREVPKLRRPRGGLKPAGPCCGAVWGRANRGAPAASLWASVRQMTITVLPPSYDCVGINGRRDLKALCDL